MLTDRKQRRLCILIGVSLAIIIMAASLSDIEFRAGRYVGTERSEPVPEGDSSSGLFFGFFLVRISLLICLAFIPIVIVYVLFSHRFRRQVRNFSISPGLIRKIPLSPPLKKGEAVGIQDLLRSYASPHCFWDLSGYHFDNPYFFEYSIS